MLVYPENLATLLSAPVLIAVAIALFVFRRNGRYAFDGSIKAGFRLVALGLALFLSYWGVRVAMHFLSPGALGPLDLGEIHVAVDHGYGISVLFLAALLVALGLAAGARGALSLIQRLKESELRLKDELAARETVQARLEQQDAHLRRAQQQAKIEYWRWSFDEGRLTARSRESLAPIDFDPDDANITYAQLCRSVHPEDRDRVIATYKASDAARSGFSIEYRRCQSDGSVVHLREIAEVEYDDAGRPVGQVGIVQDISDLKRAEAVRDSAERRFEHAERIANFCHWQDTLPDQTWTYASKNAARLFGAASVEELLGDVSSFFARVHPDDRAWLIERYEETVRTPGRFEHTYRIIHPDGSTRYLHEVGETVFDSKGRPVATRGTTRDVTAEHEAEEKARKREAALAQAQRMARLGYWRYSATRHRLIDWSRPFAEIFGVAFEDGWRTACDDLEFIHPDDRPAVRENYNAASNFGVGYDHEFRVLRPDGTVRIVREIGEPETYRDGRPATLFGTVQDITEQRKMTEALRRSEARFSGMIDITPEGIISISEAGLVTLYNRGAEAIFGYKPEEVLGRPLDMLLPESQRARHAKLVAGFAGSEEQSRLMSRRGEITGLHKDGHTFPAEASISKLTLGEEMIFTVMLRDVSDMKRSEKALQQALDEAEIANRAKSEFLANMSHELRTPLNAIIGFSELIENQAFGEIGNGRYAEYAGDIRESGQHLLALINDILDLSKVESGKMEPKEETFLVAEAVRSCIALVTERARNNDIEIQADLPETSPVALRADRRMFKQILSNLLSNAVKFTPAGGRIDVSAQVDGLSGLTVEVRDTGIGMSEKDIPKALARFGQVESHLDRKYEGTGLGLPLVKSLIELHDGVLDLRSEPQRGTSATVVFPASRIVQLDRPTKGASAA